MVATMGIDPGVRGGIAVLAPDGSVAHLSSLRPEMTVEELKHVMRVAYAALHVHLSRACYLESVGYMPGDGGQGAFTFGRISGMLEMGAAGMLSLDVVAVTPQRWQAQMQCLSGGDKNVTKRRAAEIWPSVKWTHATADAALIARYGWERLRI